MKKRIVALLLCCVMLLTLSPSLIASASADDENTVIEQTEPTEDKKDAGQVEEVKDETKAETKDETKDEVKDEAKEEQKPADEPKGEESAFDVEAAYDALMACTTVEDMIALSNKLTDEQIAMFSDEQIAALNAKYDTLLPEAPEETDESNGIVNFIDVAPFLDPVSGSSVRRAARALSNDEPERVDNAGVETSKKVSGPDKDGNYTITLESFVTGKTTTTETTTDVPTDIVLVLDQSGSMAENYSGKSYKYEAVYELNTHNTYYAGESHVKVEWCTSCNAWTDRCGWFFDHIGGTKYTPKTSATDTATGHVQFYEQIAINGTRLDALISAATSFANSVAEKAKGADGILGTKDDVNHRIAVVGFASDTNNYHNTEILTGCNITTGQRNYGKDPVTNYYSTYYFPTGYEKNGVQYGRITDAQYKAALQNMDNATGVQNVKNAFGALTAYGGTQTDHGLDMASKIFAQNPVEAGTKRNQVVIVFTDGLPTGNGSSYNSDVATNAINKATAIKNSGATIYTIGIFTGANAASAGSIGNRSTDADKGNYFLQRVSSNTEYPQTPSYYLTPSDGDALDDVFQQISDNISTGGASVKLDSTTVVKDVISDYFELPEKANKNDIHVYTAKYTGTTAYPGSWAARQELTTADVTISADGKTIDVKGFNFADNYVGIDNNLGTEKAHGAKLIIEFKVKARDGFLGGNGVPTNGTDSGIYSEGKVIENFERPTADVDIPDITVSAVDKNVYLTQVPTDAQLKEGAAATCNGVNLLNESAYTGTNAWKAKFVTISTTTAIEHANFDATADGTYTLTAKVEPTKTGTATAKSASATGNINVFKPEVTFKDSQITLGETANYEDNKPVTNFEVWKHGTTPSTAAGVTMIGTAPELKYSYDRAADAFQQDTPVKVSAVKIGDTVVTSHVTFYREACSIKTDCPDTTVKIENGANNFIVHVKSLSLKISKTYDNMLDPNQSAVFVVTGPNGTFTFEVVIHGTGSVTINGLPVGSYTVTEKNTWTWRYTGTTKQTVELKANDTTVPTVEFENKNPFLYWLTGGTYCDNRFDGKNTTITPASN